MSQLFLKLRPARSLIFFTVFLLLITLFLSMGLLDSVVNQSQWVTSFIPRQQRLMSINHITPVTIGRLSQFAPYKFRQMEFPLNCSELEHTRSCPRNYPTNGTFYDDQSSTAMCPDYFRWIHEDLRPWSKTGISRGLVERFRRTASFRLVIVDGRAYVEKFKRVYQTRDVFTLWGFLQLLRRYPGRVPDLDLLFDCVDWPIVKTDDYIKPNGSAPPTVFRYCGDDDSLDLVFPDWSFWGWPEIRIRPWESLLNELKEGKESIRWIDREPYAFWKGNPEVAETRKDLLKCNVSQSQDWNARVFAQNWKREERQGFKNSKLSSQCDYRYKIYIEGSAWSISEKYILACGSVPLFVKPHYHDFFTRSLIPMRHYWPIKEDDKCRSIKFAVDWGNSNEREAQEIGEAASEFIQEELKMDYVYDYMFHLLKEYAKLLTYKPVIPPKATELCSETMACPAEGLVKEFMMESMVKGPSLTSPCKLPPPFDPPSLHAVLSKKDEEIKRVEIWEKEYWDNQEKHQPTRPISLK